MTLIVETWQSFRFVVTSNLPGTLNLPDTLSRPDTLYDAGPRPHANR